ncbi:ATP synthase-coupling factor 6, mitochondrial [Brachionichthys hirsutus]|uniref:ATP synthase-coupling factor 6, mitochondrial n=1 Tax=Brachionichthys hirsutus TaxID=412623 RepID=UPI0036044A52
MAAAALLRMGRLGCVKALQAESWKSLRRLPAAAALSSRSDGSKKSPRKPSAPMDPIQKLFLDAIRGYSSKSRATGGLVDADSEFEKALADETSKLQRLYGGGDLETFPEFIFSEPKFDEVSQK